MYLFISICAYEYKICGSFQIKNTKERIEKLKKVSLCVFLVNLQTHITDTWSLAHCKVQQVSHVLHVI